MTNPTIQAAEAMREAAVKVAESEDRYPQSESWRSSALTIAARILALPLPEPPPDPRDTEIARLNDLMALAKAAGGATSRRRRRLMRIEKFDGDKAFVAVNAKYNEARTEIVELKARLELWDHAPREPVDATIARLAADLAAAREALAPFARVSIPDDAPDDLWTHCEAYEQDMDDETFARVKAYDPALTSRKMNLMLWIDGHPIRDFRRARAVLAKSAAGE